MLRHAIIHEIVKDVREKGTPEQNPEIKKGGLLDVTAEPVKSLVNSIKSIYGKKGNNSASGTFSEDGVGEFKRELDDFKDLENPDEDFDLEKEKFENFSLNTMKILKDKIKKSNFATGGYIVFGHYLPEEKDINSNGFVLVAMVKNKDGIRLEGLVPKETQTVDLSKLHQAVRVNIERYSNFYSANDPKEREFQTYLTFISPKINETSSGYFIDAIGCTDATPHSIATRSALVAVEKFFDQDERLKPFRREAKGTIGTKMYEISDSENAECTLDYMDVWVNLFIPEELHEEYLDTFSSFANDEPYNVPATFMSHKRTAKSAMIVKVEEKDIGWKIDFESKLLGDTEEDKLFFDRKTGRLIVRDLPQYVQDVLIAEIEGDNHNEP